MTAKKTATTGPSSAKSSLFSQVATSLGETFENRFQTVARNPHLLAVVAQSVNGAANFRIELGKLKTEISSLKARLR